MSRGHEAVKWGTGLFQEHALKISQESGVVMRQHGCGKQSIVTDRFSLVVWQCGYRIGFTITHVYLTHCHMYIQ